MTLQLTVVICTHNPRLDYLDRVLTALKAQTLPRENWELLLVDNASCLPLASTLDLSWHLHARCVQEKMLGLTAARLCGFREGTTDNFVFVDDDNVLDPSYLLQTMDILNQYSNLGAFGGKSTPLFEVEPEPWMMEFSTCLALRDLGETVQLYAYSENDVEPRHYPFFAPIGAGLVLRRQAAEIYAERVVHDSTRLALGRTGQQLVSGEDNDIVMTILEAGWAVGYFPQLQLTHLITANRLTKAYLARLNYAASCSWIQVLDLHSLCTWKKIPKWSVLPRKIKAFLNCRAWAGPAAYVRWQGACGMLEGQASLPQ
jgi:glycosyltransferase involved in cell wall biosynthesis